MNTRIPKMLVCGHDRVAGLTVDGKVLCYGAFDSSDDAMQCSSVQDKTGSNLTTQVFFGGTTSVTMDVHGNLGAAGEDDYQQASPIADWEGPFADVVCQFRHSVGLRKDGTVVACGWNDFNQCNVDGWSDIVAIDAGLFHTLGLKKDGTVVGCGDNGDHQLDITGWTDIIAIACSDNHSVGLKRDGTVVACGSSENNICDVSGWSNITKVICGNYHTVGLKSDGTVVACGSNDIGPKDLGGKCDVGSWTDVKDIYCEDFFTIGLKNDGTLLFTGNNHTGISDIMKWKDIVHIACNQLAVFGLKKDGHVVTCGKDDFFTYDPVKKWKLFDSYETVDEDFEASLKKRTETKPAGASKAKQPDSAVISVARTAMYKGFAKEVVIAIVAAALLLLAVVFLPKEIPVTLPDSSATETTAASYSIAYVTASSGLNVRSGPGSSYDRITTLPYDACVTVYETDGDWARIGYEDQEGWCSLNYLRYAQ